MYAVVRAKSVINHHQYQKKTKINSILKASSITNVNRKKSKLNG